MDDEKFYLDTIERVIPNHQEKLAEAFYEFLELEHLYDSAAETVRTQLNIYDNEFSMKFQRNPIHGIESRIKSPQSIVEKLRRKGYPLSAKSAREHLTDIAGVRVVCYYVSDIYTLAELLTMRGDFKPVKIKDYIKTPKPSGYRSLHLIVMVPVYLSSCRQEVPVEIQVRTIGMDYWASLEHQLHYKTNSTIPPELSDELTELAGTIRETDQRMQAIYDKINTL